MMTRVSFLIGMGVILSSAARAELVLPGVFSDHMVLQREMAIPIWGTAGPGETVTVSFGGQKAETKAQGDGTWRIELKAMEASARPRSILITAGGEERTIEDVLVGEVWVGSGQSNMAGGTGSYAKKDATLAELLAEAPYPAMRLLRSVGATGPKGLAWSESTPEQVQSFSALLFAFGHRIHDELDVPVGLIVGAVGGTPSGSWLSKRAFEEDEGCRRVVAEFSKTYHREKAQEQYEAALGRWEDLKKRAEAQGAKPPRKPNPPVDPGQGQRGEIGNLYERYIRPVVGYGMRGVLWDQGEAGTAVLGVDQYTLMGALISGWRKEWGEGEFPFIYVQKPSGGGPAWDDTNPVTREAEDFVAALPAKMPGDGSYRELHIRIAEYPNTWMASASDLGPMVHPVNKWGYGNRAAEVAMHAAYGRKGPVYGPTYSSHQVEGAKVRVRFENTGSGLAFKGGEKLQGFAVAGADRVFHWAEATIEGKDVVVSASEVAEPVAVRYGWARVHPWANFFNKNGLPALTFRTDDW